MPPNVTVLPGSELHPWLPDEPRQVSSDASDESSCDSTRVQLIHLTCTTCTGIAQITCQESSLICTWMQADR